MLQLEDVSKRYTAPEGEAALDVLSGISLQLAAGESLAIVGPSGSGKSTLLNLIGGLDRPTSGRVLLDGDDLAQMDDGRLASLRNKRIGFVFQSHHLLPQCTVWENVLVPTLAGHDPAPWDEREKRGKLLLERVGLAERMTHRPGQLSGGECLRVAIARALINGPALLLADEPTGSLDAATSDRIADLLVELNTTEGLTLVVVTHSMALARRMGRLLELGAPEASA